MDEYLIDTDICVNYLKGHPRHSNRELDNEKIQ